MNNHPVSYLSPEFEARPCPNKGGWGIFAKARVEAGRLISVWGGTILTMEELNTLPAEYQGDNAVQIEEDLYLVTFGVDSPGDYVNHSCDPNAWLAGQIALFTMKPIEADEEVSFDYATSDGSPYCEFNCECGTPNCRGKVTGNDWQIPELWERYAGHFSPYLQRRIDKLRKEQESGS